MHIYIHAHTHTHTHTHMYVYVCVCVCVYVYMRTYVMGTISLSLLTSLPQSHKSPATPRKSRKCIHWSETSWANPTACCPVQPEIGPVLSIFWDQLLKGWLTALTTSFKFKMLAFKWIKFQDILRSFAWSNSKFFQTVQSRHETSEGKKQGSSGWPIDVQLFLKL